MFGLCGHTGMVHNKVISLVADINLVIQAIRWIYFNRTIRDRVPSSALSFIMVTGYEEHCAVKVTAFSGELQLLHRV